MTRNQIARTVEIYEEWGFIGEELSDMVRSSVADDYKSGQLALIHFGAIDAPIGQESSEFNETPDLIGEVYSDYEEVMEEFLALCV